MKKLISLMLAFVLVSFVFTSCGQNDKQETNESLETSPELAAQVEKARDFVREETGAEIELRGNSVVYVFTVDESKEDCRIAANAVEDTVLEALEEAKKDLPMIESFIYEYRDADGNVIYSEEYKIIA